MAAMSGEFAFLAITVGITALHIVGMNYAFYCHAAWFYSSPLIVVAAAVAVEYVIQTDRKNRVLLIVLSAVPIIAIFLATSPFRHGVPVNSLPKWLRDPMFSVCLIAMAAWWFGYMRHHGAPALHAGSAALALAAYRGIKILHIPALDSTIGIATTENASLAFFITTGYFAICASIRRSRWEALTALLTNLAAVILLVWKRAPADGFVICLALGWSFLIGSWIALRRMHIFLQIVPICFLLVTSCVYDYNSGLTWAARSHGLVLIVAMFVVGFLRHWPGSRLIACALGGPYFGFLLSRSIDHQGSAIALVAVTGAFGLLLAGALVSWHKEQLIGSIRHNREETRGLEPGPSS